MSRGFDAAASWLSLAAAPTFAAAASVTAVLEARAAPSICSIAPGDAPFSAMTAMYLLMSAFHLGSWLKLAARRARRP